MNKDDFNYSFTWQQAYAMWKPVNGPEIKIDVVDDIKNFDEAKQVIDYIKSKL